MADPARLDLAAVKPPQLAFAQRHRLPDTCLARVAVQIGRHDQTLPGQRVAIGRAIVRGPEVFLFDEPLSNLDAELRVEMRVEIARLHKEIGATMIYVTHDQVEAMTMADKIVVLRAGYIEQVGSPLELYHKPRNLFVAGFIGSPTMNLFEGATAAEHGAHTIGVRPEHLVPSKTEGLWKGRVGLSEHLGSDTFLHIHDTGLTETITVRAGGDIDLHHNDTVYLTPEADKICLLYTSDAADE